MLLMGLQRLIPTISTLPQVLSTPSRLLYQLPKRLLLTHALLDVADHVSHFIVSLQSDLFAGRVTIEGRLGRPGSVSVKFDEREEVAGLGVVHGMVVVCIVAVDVALADCVLTLAEDGDQDDDVVEGTKEEGDDQQLAVSDVDWDVNVETT